ncbi:MAG TPA: hypothetical protein VHM24_08490 [Gemmatimonadaceae bacterium]|nr:hypothetical protein [Gemmatimonadaceae bacterium]
MRRWSLLLLFPALAACLSLEVPSAQTKLPPGGLHVLFIGNSLTYTNDLPKTVSDIAASAGDTIRVATVARPSFAVIDHALGYSDAVDVIKSQSWDYVVLQQGPTTTMINRDTLIIATKLLNPLIRASGGRTAQLMVWPDAESPQLFPAVRASSQAASEAVGGVFIPAGDAWRAALEANPGLQLYSADRFHPSRLGTYLAALVVYERLTGRDARELTAAPEVAGTRLIAAEETVRFLQRMAHEAVGRFATN